MSIKVNSSITSKDDFTVSLGHSSRGVYVDLTQNLVYEITKEEDSDEEEDDISMWKIDMTLPYPHSQASGDLTLSIGDNHSGDITTSHLIIGQDGNNDAPYFDPVPKSQKLFTGQNVLINTKVIGPTPLMVRIT